MTSFAATMEPQETLYVVHPMDDAPEQKRSADGLSPMKMTPTVKASLYVLRGYLIVVVCLTLYRIVDLFLTGAHHVR